jgi:hypothetical protein
MRASLAKPIESPSNSPSTSTKSVIKSRLDFTPTKARWHSIRDDDEFLDSLTNTSETTLGSFSDGSPRSSDEGNGSSSDNEGKHSNGTSNGNDNNQDEDQVEGDVAVQGVDVLCGKTTVVIHGIPISYAQEQVRKEMDNLGFEGLYDFFYLPPSRRGMQRSVNRGFAFANFIASEHAEAFFQTMHGRTLEAGAESSTIKIMAAEVQGFENNARKFTAEFTRFQVPGSGKACGSRVTRQRRRVADEVFIARPLLPAGSESFEEDAMSADTNWNSYWDDSWQQCYPSGYAVYVAPFGYAYDTSYGQDLMTGDGFCPHCGVARLVRHANFCHACGERVPCI